MDIRSNEGSSELTGIVIIFLILSLMPLFSSLLGTYNKVVRLNQIADTTVNMAKMVGGFDNRVINSFDNMMDDLGIDNSEIECVFIPGKNTPVNKRDTLEVDLVYKGTLDIIKFDENIIRIKLDIPVSSKACSHYYRK